jgi:hypothetical protein
MKEISILVGFVVLLVALIVYVFYIYTVNPCGSLPLSHMTANQLQECGINFRN